MIRRLINGRPLVAFTPLFWEDNNPYDRVLGDEKVSEPDPNETGWQRLKNLFKPYNKYEINPRLVHIMHTCLGTFVIGGIYGAVVNSRKTFINFLESNEATSFRNHYQAKRQLSDKMFTSSAIGFVKFGTKVSLFTTTFAITYTILTTYQNKDSIFHYAAGGMTAGTLYKFNLGPKGMLSGAFFGSIFGVVYGTYMHFIFKLMNLTSEKLSEQNHKLKYTRQDLICKAEKEVQYEEAKEELIKFMTRLPK